MGPLISLGLAGFGFVVFAIALRKTLRAGGVWRKLAWGMMALFVLVISIGFALPNFVEVREVVCRNACPANLKMIEGFKDTWALENQKTGADTPTESDLFDSLPAHIRETLSCPQGGIYRLGTVNEKPTCSLGGIKHTCP
jgi:hypothetical protein